MEEESPCGEGWSLWMLMLMWAHLSHVAGCFSRMGEGREIMDDNRYRYTAFGQVSPTWLAPHYYIFTGFDMSYTVYTFRAVWYRLISFFLFLYFLLDLEKGFFLITALCMTGLLGFLGTFNNCSQKR